MATSKTVELSAFGIDNIKIVERPRPVPGAGEVLVNIKLRPVNPADFLSVLGVYPGFAPKSFPATPGLEGYGIVAEVGAGVTAVKVGQRVVPLASAKDGNGTWQEYVVISQYAAIPVPDNVSDASAAQLFVNPLSVLGMLRNAAVPHGEYILQDAAGSTLGRQLIQVAKARGIKTANVVRRTAQIEELKAIGADVVVSTEGLNTAEEIAEAILAATAGKRAYAAVSAVGGQTTSALTIALRDGGLVQVYGVLQGVHGHVHIPSLLFRGITVKGYWLSADMGSLTDAERTAAIAEAFDLMGKGLMVPNSGEIYQLENVAAALIKSNETARGGKILLASP
eukprot:jgi/Hompol1/4321/HPOL_001575-RA